MAERSLQGGIALRVEAVRRLILNGESRFGICQFASNNWSVDFRTADRYIAQAWTGIKEAAKVSAEQNLAEAIAARRELRRKAYESKDYKTVLAILQDEAKLLDLYPAVKYDILLQQEAERVAAVTGKSKHDVLADVHKILAGAE